MGRVTRTATNLVVLILAFTAFMVLIYPMLPGLASSIEAFIYSYSYLFKYNVTQYEYVYVNNTAMLTSKIVTIDYTPILVIGLRALIVFLPLILVLVLLLRR